MCVEQKPHVFLQKYCVPVRGGLRQYFFSNKNTLFLIQERPNPKHRRKPQEQHGNLKKQNKNARAVTRTTPEIRQAPVPSHPGTKYPVRGNPSLRFAIAYAEVCELAK